MITAIGMVMMVLGACGLIVTAAAQRAHKATPPPPRAALPAELRSLASRLKGWTTEGLEGGNPPALMQEAAAAIENLERELESIRNRQQSDVWESGV